MSLKKRITSTRVETRYYHRVLDTFGPGRKSILDVGCGYGRNLKPAAQRGHDVTGVEVNRQIVDTLAGDGYTVYHPDDLPDRRYDMIIMAHIIEHFAPEALFELMNHYLDYLKDGGHLYIATPLLHPYFYVDFDHVRPYHPRGVQMVFDGTGAQVQYYGRHRLELVDVKFRRVPRSIQYSAPQLLGRRAPAVTAYNLASGLAYHASGGLISRISGWMGVWQKVGDVPGAEAM